MSTTTFPYTGWVLMPSFKPVEVTLEKEQWGEWHVASSGKVYHPANIFQTRDAAIAWGHADLEKQQAAIDKKQANLHKRRAELEKASKEAS